MLYDHDGEIKSKRVVLGFFFGCAGEKKKERKSANPSKRRTPCDYNGYDLLSYEFFK